MNLTERSNLVKSKAVAAGFDTAAICPAVTPPGSFDYLSEWLGRGYAGQMDYIPNRLDAYADPSRILDGARSIVMLTLNYGTDPAKTRSAGQGKISRYAWGSVDYHDLIHARLKELIRELARNFPNSRFRGVVDSAPLLERQFAQQAGLGWQGKNTLLLNRDAGSLFFLAALLTDQELDYDQRFESDHCGTCTACLDACPTDAFPQPYVLDATRCISYLTIELRDPIPEEHRDRLDGWLFGCDVCQDVCPWNQKAPHSDVSDFRSTPGNNPVDLIALVELDDDAFRARFRKTPLWRSKRRGILRNAVLLLGAQAYAPAEEPLIKLLHDSESLVRGAAAWALGQLGTDAAIKANQLRRQMETDEGVLREIDNALANN